MNAETNRFETSVTNQNTQAGLQECKQVLFRLASRIGMPLNDPDYHDFLEDSVTARIDSDALCLETIASPESHGQLQNPLATDHLSLADLAEDIDDAVTGRFHFDTKPYAYALTDSLVYFAEGRAGLRTRGADDGHLATSVSEICDEYSGLRGWQTLDPRKMEDVRVAAIRHSSFPGICARNWYEFQLHVVSGLVGGSMIEVGGIQGQFYSSLAKYLNEQNLEHELLKLVSDVAEMKQPRIQTSGAIKKKCWLPGTQAQKLAAIHKVLPRGAFDWLRFSRGVTYVKKNR